MAVHLYQKTAEPDSQVSLFILGMHNSHGDAQVDVEVGCERLRIVSRSVGSSNS